MKKNIQLYIYLLLITALSACSPQKFIPKGEYLLDEVNIVSDTKEVSPSLFYTYIRQNPNAKWFNLVKVPMNIYCLSGRDSSKAFNRFLRKLGDEPVIFDPVVTQKTRKEMEKGVRNMGYLRAKVHLDTVCNNNKLKLKYRIEADKPYTVRHIAYHIDDLMINDYVEKDSMNTYLQNGMLLDVLTLDNERQRITKLLKDNGYYKFNKEFIEYQADTVRNTYSVDLTLRILPFRQKKEDIPTKHKQYTVRNVSLVTEDVAMFTDVNYEQYDSMQHKGLNIYYKDKPYFRPNVLSNFNYIEPNALYNDQDVQNTYKSMSRLRTLKYTNIMFEEVGGKDSTMLDANLLLTKGRDKSLSFEIEGTNSAGDLGAAASLTFQHRNAFKGSETFTLKARGAYEAITGLQEGYGRDDYKEYGFEASLNFPEFKFPFLTTDFKKKIQATSEVGVDFNSQLRPEFIRTLASASWSYRWVDRKKSQHRLDLLDVNYVYVPWKSQTFKDYLDNLSDRNSILIKSYEDQLIVSMGYNYSYNSAKNLTHKSKNQYSYSFRFNIEEAGNLLYLASKTAHSKPKSDMGYEIANIPFAQYVKGDFDFAQHWNIDQRNSLVFHIGMGVAYPYGNSKVLPFEKRYFAGGPNSVRGWSVRSLGPGSYKNEEGKMNYIDHTGDIKLDLNIEYRTHLFWKFNGAVFVDAGNIWNIHDYEGQEEGTFKFDRFYKQLAVSYGLGLRFDLDYLIIRFDGGMKAVNPTFTGKDKYPFLRPNFDRDFTFHFAVGYPF